MDYQDGRTFNIEGVIYKVRNRSSPEIMQEILNRKLRIAVNIQNIPRQFMDKIGLYTDGHYAEDFEEVSGIIQGKPANDDTVYAAVRTAFTKEELTAHSDWAVWVHIIVDGTGRIIETSTTLPIRHDYVIQPEQVHILETTLKNTLIFTLDQEEASKFEWFQGQILIRFKDYIEDRTLSKIDNFIESPNL